MSTEKRNCPVTGRPIEERAGRGRPREYATEDAQRLWSVWRQFQDLIRQVSPDMTPSAKREWRSRLVSALNQGSLRPTPEAFRRAQARTKKAT